MRVRLDLEALLAPAVLPDAFDSILVASAQDGKGQVLFQQGEPELQLTALRAVVEATGGEQEEDGGVISRYLPASNEVELGTAGLLGAPATGSVSVEVAEVEYRLFFQPIVLELPALRDEESEAPVHWVVGGFVSSARLLSASFTSSPVLLAALLSIFPLGVLSWPFLKLWLVSPRQRLTRVDVTFLVLSTFLGCFFLTLLFLGLSFRSEVQSQVDRQLEELATRLEEDLFAELGEAYRQLEHFRREDPAGIGTRPDSRAGSEGSLEGVLYRSPRAFRRSLWEAGSRVDGASCRHPDHLGLLPRQHLSYPTFHSVFWVDECGDQGAKVAFREHSVRKTSVYGRGYFECLAGHTEPYRLEVGPGGSPVELCLESVISNTGGADQVILAIPRPGETPWRCAEHDPLLGQDGDPSGQNRGEHQPVMATRLASLTEVVVPPTFGFAVVDASEDDRAEVLFHSDPRRILSEDLLKASDENALLASMLSSRRKGELGLRYWGRRHRAHVGPLPGLPWSLVTFRSHQDLRMRSIELLYDVANPTLLIFVPIYLLFVGILGFSKRRLRLPLWPDYDKNEIYRWIVLGSLFMVGLFGLLLGVERASPPGGAPLLFWATVVLPIAALVVGMGAMVLHDRGEGAATGKGSRWVPVWRKWGQKVRSWLDARAEILFQGMEWLGLLMALRGLVFAPSVSTFVLFIAALVIWICWRRYRLKFQRQQRRRSYIFAMSCLLVLVAVLPALGFYSLARERQWSFIVQETQEGLHQALQEHHRRTIGSHEEARPFFEAYEKELRELRRAWLLTFFSTRLDGGKAATDQAGHPPGWPWEGWHAGRFSPRPVPVNDLSAEPRGVDLSRFETPRRSWWWVAPEGVPEVTEEDSPGSSPGPWMAASLQDDSGTGPIHHFYSRVPLRELGWRSGALAFLGYVLLGVLWLACPVLLVGLVAHRVLFVSLATVEREDRARDGEEGESNDLPDLGTVQDLLNPDNLRQDRMLLVLGVPELALQAVADHLDKYLVAEWDDDGPDGGFWRRLRQAERSRVKEPLPLMITRFRLDLAGDREGAERTTRKLRKLNELYRQGRRPIVILADLDPRVLLAAGEQEEEDPASHGAALRREWSALLGTFTFRYASDRGRPGELRDQVQRKRINLLRSWGKETGELYSKRNEAETEVARLEEEVESLREKRRGQRQPSAALNRQLAKLEEELEKARVFRDERREKVHQHEAEANRNYQEAFRALDILEEECRRTGKLQEIGAQVLREAPEKDFEAFTREKMVAKIALLARAYYQAIWASTSEDEKVVLAQLAHTGLVSPKNRERVLDLMYRGLVVRDPALRLMNESFALFVRQTVGKTQLLEWEGEEGTSVWTILRWLLPVPLLLLGGFVFITQRDAVSSAIGFLIAAASVAPTLINLFGYFEQRFAQRVAREERERARAVSAPGRG